MTRRLSFDAIGTKWSLQAQSAVSDTAWRELIGSIRQRIEQFDRHYSRFRKDSLVTQLSQQAGTHELPADGFDLLNFYHQLYEATDGYITPLIGQVISDAGYDAEYSLQSKMLSRPPVWDDIISYNEHSLTLARPALLDFGAAGKGYLVDIIGSMLSEAGLADFYIDAGGDIRQQTNRGDVLRVGMENPQDTSQAVGVVSLCNQSLCASAGSRRHWGEYHHIIDPQQLVSPQSVLSTWVVAADTMTADGLATALFFTTPAALHRQFSFEHAVLRDGMSLERSAAFPAEIFEAAA